MFLSSRTLAATTLTVLGFQTAALAGEALITYEFRFDAAWSNATHPTDFPGNPHFSPLIGGTHHSGVSFWEPGGLATAGIERMAETGGPNLFRTEVQDAIAIGNAETVIDGDGINSPGTTTTSFDASDSHPLVTLVTMIAPSPDWFVGVHGLALQNNDGLWLSEIVVELDPYDAGTDNGISYTSPNANTNPQDPISNLFSSFPFNSGGPIGTFTFTRITEAPCSLADTAAPFGVLDIFDVFDYLDAFNAGDPSADLTGDGVLDVFDVFAYLDLFNAGCVV